MTSVPFGQKFGDGSAQHPSGVYWGNDSTVKVTARSQNIEWCRCYSPPGRPGHCGRRRESAAVRNPKF